MTGRRTVFCVSDHTGVTAEAFAHSVLSQFDAVYVTYLHRPFVDTVEKAAAVVAEIDAVAATGARPMVFSTFIDPGLQSAVGTANGLVIAVLDQAVKRVADEVGAAPSSRVGSYHSIGDATRYQLRLDAVDFSLMTDDGLGLEHYDRADVILVGVSRVGKTPSCLYLSMQYAIRAANYPLSYDDHESATIPATLQRYRDRLYGLTIEPRRLHAIRQQRRPDSAYAALEMCKRDVVWAERLFAATGIPYIDTTARSIEEITATILDTRGLTRRID